MVLVETYFIGGQPVGRIHEDIMNGVVTFQPRDNVHLHLARRKWKSVTACQRAILKSYKNENPPK